MRFLSCWVLLAAAGLCFGGCGGPEENGDGDADSDSDGDTDGDTDSDGDSDGDGDGDGDADEEIIVVGPDGFFTPDNSIFTGVVITDDGITLSGTAVVNEIIWLTNSLEGSISKINTRTLVEEGRYYTGPALATTSVAVDPDTGECPEGTELDEAGTACTSPDYHSNGLYDGPGHNPSRTSVDPFGNAYVANRAFTSIPSVTKINHRCQARGPELVTWAPDGDADLANNPPPLRFTVDTNDTPSPWDDTFSWDDDCIVWHLRGMIDALDRQELGGADDGTRTQGALGRGVVIQQREGADGLFHTFGWLSIHYMRQYYEFDGETGELTGRVIQFPGCTPYGAAIDRFGILWSSCLSGSLGRADTDPELVADQPADGVPDPVVVGTAGHCLDAGGNEIEETTCIYGEDIPMQSGTYGITIGPAIDEDDPPVRVYSASYGISEYTPAWTNAAGDDVPASEVYFSAAGGTQGVGVDPEGIVWSHSGSGFVVRLNPTKVTGGVPDADAVTIVPAGRGGTGIGIATDGMIWAVNWSHYDPDAGLQNDGNVTLIDPHPAADNDGDGDPDGALPEDYVGETCCEEISNSYTYSDVTGFQLSASLAPLGEFRFFIPPCDDGATTWGDIAVAGEFPDGTSLIVQAKIVEGLEDLSVEDGWVSLLLEDGADRLDGDHPTGGTFVMPELPGEGALGLRVTLTTDDQSRVIRPSIESVGIGRACQ